MSNKPYSENWKSLSNIKLLFIKNMFILYSILVVIMVSNMTSLFPFAKKNTELFLRIISLAHAPMNVTDVSIGSINCDPNNADRGRSIIRVT